MCLETTSRENKKHATTKIGKFGPIGWTISLFLLFCRDGLKPMTKNVLRKGN